MTVVELNEAANGKDLQAALATIAGVVKQRFFSAP
jgi:hypothetical protein